MSVASAFIAGLKLFLTPGVLPVIPLLAFALLLGNPSIRRGITISLAFTVPMAIGFVVLRSGIALTEAGIEIQPIAQSVWIVVPSVLVLLGLAAMETDIAKIREGGLGHQAGTLYGFVTSALGVALLGLISLIYTTPFTSSSTAAVMLYLKAGGAHWRDSATCRDRIGHEHSPSTAFRDIRGAAFLGWEMGSDDVGIRSRASGHCRNLGAWTYPAWPNCFGALWVSGRLVSRVTWGFWIAGASALAIYEGHRDCGPVFWDRGVDRDAQGRKNTLSLPGY